MPVPQRPETRHSGGGRLPQRGGLTSRQSGSTMSEPRPDAKAHILPPRALSRGKFAPKISDEQLNQLATLLDDKWRMPGLNFRFGLDPLIGLIPGLGDMLGGIISFLIIFAAWQRGLPKVTLARMVVNEVIDTFGGAIPIIGDAFDVYWKSNRMNYNLILRHRNAPEKSHSWKDWLFLVALFGSCMVVAALPFVALALLVVKLRH